MRVRWMFRVTLAASCLFARGLWAADAVTSLPPHVVCIPLPTAYKVAKHPSLPVLYVGCYTPGQTNRLVTFRLAADGAIVAGSQRECEDYFLTEGMAKPFDHRILRPAINAVKKLLYLPAYPEVPPYTPYADTNNCEFAVVALDDEGQPSKRLRLFRTDITGTQGLIRIGFDPHFARLWLAYYSSFCWLDLGPDGLPITDKVGWLQQFWQWQYVPDWQRFYLTRPDSTLTIFKFASDGVTGDFVQNVLAEPGSTWTGDVAVNVGLRKAYVCTSIEKKELAVYTLDKEGRFTGVPRSFELGPTSFLCCDFKTMTLHAVGTEGLRSFKLGADGFPTGKPRFHPYDWGFLNDVWLDEATGTLYIACSKPIMP